MNPVRAVLFDVDGTLYGQFPLRLAMVAEMGLSLATSWGRGRKTARIVTTFRHERERLRGHDCSVEPLARRQYSIVADRLDVSAEEVERVVTEWMYERPLKWLRFCRRPGLRALLHFLDERSVRKGVLSDYPAKAKLDALGIASYFDLLLSAVDGEVGAFKPSPRGYAAAARQWGLAPSEILYVGDRADVDPPGALAAGMQCAIVSRRRPRTRDGVLHVTDFKELQGVLSKIC